MCQNGLHFHAKLLNKRKMHQEIAVFTCDAYDLFEVSTVSRLEDLVMDINGWLIKNDKMI